MTQPTKIGIAILAIVIVAGGIYVAVSNPREPVAQTVSAQTVTVSEGTVEASAETVMSAPAVEPDSGTAAASAESIDVGAALAERSLGSADAPVVIEEYASLSCSHCAHFHEGTLPKLKENYIDTGKVRFVYNDFPLNAPAIDGAMVARCLPERNYFKFIGFLFENQEKWAYSGDHQKHLIQNAKLLGASEDMLKSCLANDELKDGLLVKLQKAKAEHDITSTPSFVVNGKEVLAGARSYEHFSKVIDKLLEESQPTE